MSSTLAEQLAPLATKPNPNAWRALMSPKELAAFDEGKYNSRTTAPLESARISRDNRLDRFDDDNESANRGTPTPEQNAQAAEMARGFEIVGTISRPCGTCGQPLPAKGKAKTIVARYSDDCRNAKAFLLCDGCWDSLGWEPSTDPLFDNLPALDKKVWQLATDGLTGVEIAARLSVNGRRLSQQQASEAKLRVLRQIKENRHSTKYELRIQ